MSNGVQSICADASSIPQIEWLQELPSFPIK